MVASILDARHSTGSTGDTRRKCAWNSRRGNHLGQRSSRPHPTGRTYGCKRCAHFLPETSCKPGAVHIWTPAFAGVTSILVIVVPAKGSIASDPSERYWTALKTDLPEVSR